MKWIGLKVTAAILLFVTVQPCFCVGRTVSSDILPREHWSYDAMAHFAARMSHPSTVKEAARFFQGDFLLSELEMAERVKSLIEDEKFVSRLSFPDREILRRLAQEFSPHLDSLGAQLQKLGWAGKSVEEARLVLSGYIRPILRLEEGEGASLATYEANVLAVLGSYGLFAATLQNSDKEFRARPGAFSNVSKLLFKRYGKDWELELGRDAMSWSPAYSGSMILSDNAPAFDFLRYKRDFSFGRRIGRIQITQFAAPFEDNGKDLWLLGRRWQKTFSNHFTMGVNETAKTSRRPKPIVILLPSLYLYQNIYVDDVDAEWNSFVSVDGLYRTGKGKEFYWDVVIDDITAPGPLGAGFDRPRKAGLLIGAYMPKIGSGGRTSARIEVIMVDRETYLASRPAFPEMEYSRDGIFIGHPLGNDSEAIFLRLAHRASSSFRLVGELLAARRKSDGERSHAANLAAILDMGDGFSGSLRWRKFRELPDGHLELAASYAF